MYRNQTWHKDAKSKAHVSVDCRLSKLCFRGHRSCSRPRRCACASSPQSNSSQRTNQPIVPLQAAEAQFHSQPPAGNVNSDEPSAGADVWHDASSAEEPSTSQADLLDTPSPSGVYRPVHAVLQSAESMGALASCENAASCISRFAELANAQGALAVLTEQDCLAIIAEAFDRENATLAQGIYAAMGKVGTGTRAVSGLAPSQALTWPPATPKTTELMVLLLAQELRVQDALDVVKRIRERGMPCNEEVPFGLVVESPLAPGQPLTVAQPQEGSKIAVCAKSRYEFELFSGTVSNTPKSEALNAGEGSLWQRLLRRRDVAQANHSVVIRAPAGESRTFRVATNTEKLPAKEGERVTVIMSPSSNATLRKGGLFSSRPPRTRPGEPLAIVSHATSISTPLVRPTSDRKGFSIGFRGMMTGAAVLCTLGAASGFVDPELPAQLAGGAALLTASSIGSRNFVFPRLKQLPESAVANAEIQQQLLQQHSNLMSKARALMASIEDDVRSLARLWQLQAKMQSVGSTYSERLSQVAQARSRVQEQLCKRLELLEGYSRIGSMIEIEVEMSTEVNQSQMDDISAQISDLADVEEMQKDWELQAEAKDELERLLRASP